MTCTGMERLDVVQMSHWKLAEMIGDAKRNIKSSESLCRVCVMRACMWSVHEE